MMCYYITFITDLLPYMIYIIHVAVVFWGELVMSSGVVADAPFMWQHIVDCANPIQSDSRACVRV